MPYTNSWNVTDPPGTELAKNIDNQIRKLRVDIDERFATFMVDQTTDPIELKPQYLGNVTGKSLVLPYGMFMCETGGKQILMTDQRLQAYTDTGPLICPIVIPPGCTMTKAELMFDREDADSITWNIMRRAFAAGGGLTDAVSIQAIGPVANVGVYVSATPDFAEAIAGTNMYWISVEGNGAAGKIFSLFGARITYNTPDTRNTY